MNASIYDYFNDNAMELDEDEEKNDFEEIESYSKVYIHHKDCKPQKLPSMIQFINCYINYNSRPKHILSFATEFETTHNLTSKYLSILILDCVFHKNRNVQLVSAVSNFNDERYMHHLC